MAFDPITSVFNLGSQIIDKIWPDKSEAEKAKLELMKMSQEGEFKELEARYSAIVQEAKSSDPWTSRARPSFLYTMYILLLASIPFGVVFVFKPDAAMLFVQGFKSWFQAIPDSLYALFGAGYLGYSHYRSKDKEKVML